LGGEAEVYRQSEDLIGSAALLPVTDLLCSAWAELADKSAAQRLLISAVDRTIAPGVLGDLVDSLLDNADLAVSSAAFLADTLANRVQRQENETSGIALEAYARLVLGGLVPRWGLLDLITRHEATSDELFGRHLIRVSSALYDQYAVTELKSAMETLFGIAELKSDCAFALGLTELRDALDGLSPDSIASHLRQALSWFTSAEEFDEDRADARLYRLAVECILALEAGTAPDLTRIVPQLEATITMRQAWASERSGIGLTGAREQAEIEWFMFARACAAAAGLMSEPSWLHPEDAIAQLLAAYSAARSVRVPLQERSGRGLIGFVEPAISAQLVRERGLRHHLERWVQAHTGEAPDRAAIQHLLELSKKAQSRSQGRQFG